MTTTYGTCALQMPSNYVVMDAEEMEYLDGGAPSCKTLANNLKGLWLSSEEARRAFKLAGYTLSYFTRIAAMSYTVVAAGIAAQLGVTLGSINLVLGIIAAACAVGVVYYLSTNRVFY